MSVIAHPTHRHDLDAPADCDTCHDSGWMLHPLDGHFAYCSCPVGRREADLIEFLAYSDTHQSVFDPTREFIPADIDPPF